MSYDTTERSIYGGEPVECYKINQMADEWLLTSSDRTVEITDFGAFLPSAVKAGGQEYGEDQEGDLELELPRTSEIVQPYVAFSAPEPTWVRVYRTHIGDEDNYVCLFTGTILRVKFQGSLALAQCSPVLASLNRRIPGLAFTSQCNWPLFGTGCGLTKSEWRCMVTIEEISGVSLTSSQFGEKPDGYFTAGHVEGPFSEKRFITAHSGDEVTLMNPFGSTLEVGHVVDAYPGCMRTRDVCKEKFTNGPRFLGFPYFPTRDPNSQRIGVAP